MSPLGFGCSRLVGPLRTDDAVRLLETAFDAGITHFDVARSYGSGDAESVLGTFLRGRRDRVTVTSKFGVQPAPLVSRGRILVSTARRVMRLAPPLRRALGRTGAALVTRTFDAATASASLETSLRRLGTDYLDLYLLHDPVPGGFASPELLDFLEGAVRAGTVRRFGIAAPFDDAVQIVEQEPAFAPAVQCDTSVLRPAAAHEAMGGRIVAAFGALSELGRVRTLLNQRPEIRTAWGRELDVDLTVDATVSALLLAVALDPPGRPTIIFSSTTPDHVVANAQVAVAPPYKRGQLERFASLVRDALA